MSSARLGCLWVFAACYLSVAAPAAPVSVELFFETGCESCAVLKKDVFPELERRYGDVYSLFEYDIGVTSNYLKLVAYQETLGVSNNAPVSVVVEGRILLAGLKAIRKDLFPSIESAVARRMTEGDAVAPVPGLFSPDAEVVRRRVERFTLAGIIGAAAVDSINPCAISSLVFFMSLLTAARVGVRRIALAGGGFVVASFVTYFCLGLGLLKALAFISEWYAIKTAVELGLMVLMVGFAYLSFRDAIRYRRSGRPGDVLLRLPDSIQARIHRVMKSGLKTRHLVLGGLGIGVAVTVLESVCTGQVYVPALAMMIREGQAVSQCLVYLVVYNAVFVLPMVVVLWLACAGLGTPTLVEWSRRNVVISKVLLGLFFVLMAGLMVGLRFVRFHT